ncbi:hypothetical protein [Paraburkholderia sartisoli]|uniref:Apea-like HEPN domain-containing protein n=1 Tax=Paraburkholderia sartisoli TaxID=83784 RepID=A0A1H4A321_9BURK|nr:hypothetical protein [Paraburkholderia sartisoli]SEA30439.1 hypothetical protein SAMN05192564_1011011 [Paraburkholderia sartisoli]
MNLSYYALQQLGYRRRDTRESLTVSFSRVSFFGLQGFVLPADSVVLSNGVVDGAKYSACLANSVNAATSALVDEQYCEDEQAWQTERKCSPPYLVVLVGPTNAYAMTGEYIKEEADGYETYDGFPDAKAELRVLQEAALPAVLSSVACAFSAPDHPVSMKELARETFGTTSTGARVIDIKLRMEGTLLVSRSLTSEEASANFHQATKLAATMSPKVSRFFNLALFENDSLKRFLYFFLTIERQTHLSFASAEHTDGSKNLRDRFDWCTANVWSHVTDVDVQIFAKVKKVRDQIAHGEIAEPTLDVVADAARLATTLQLGG